MNELTRILPAIQHGDSRATDQLLPLIYGELRAMAARKMANERAGHTLQPTALVHECWLRLVSDGTPKFTNRAHFFGAAAEAMRRILIESARRRKCMKHGAHLERVDVEAVELPLPMPEDQLLALDDALDQLAAVDVQAAEVVKLCFFVGLTQEQAAKALDLSVSTVERRWAFARAWLFHQMQKADGKESPVLPSLRA